MSSLPTDLDSPPFLLDTNIVVYYVRDNEVKRIIEQRFALLMARDAPLINLVIEAEIRSIAASRAWGNLKRDQMEFLFSTFRKVTIERTDTIEAYVRIDVYSHRQGIGMGKNDLWIEATASVTGATLLTTDKDFNHLDPQFLTRMWVDPETKTKTV